MKEEEAKTKWCPFKHEGPHSYCIASDCMMWVKDMQGVRKEDGDMEFVKLNSGHCGLAK